MLVYKDLFTEDELLSDSYAKKIKLVDEVIYEVQGKLTTSSEKIDDSLFGGNASADGPCGDDGVDANVTSGVDVVLSYRLVETTFNKKSYAAHIKEYSKKILEKLEGTERAAIFKTNMQKFVGCVIKNFKEYQFFVGESMQDGMVVLMKYEDEQPKLYFFKDGLQEEKY